jgi:hypothetical protein
MMLHKKELRKQSYKDATAILKDIGKQIADDKVIEPIKNFFSKKNQKNLFEIKQFLWL